MKECEKKSIKETIIMFLVVIVYCTLSILYEFSFIDLAYLLVVIGFFAVYLKKVKLI